MKPIEETKKRKFKTPRYSHRPKLSEETKAKISKSRGGKNSYTAFHRLSRQIMEKHLGRKLLPTEIVHHKDENQENNEISNLQLCSSIKEHEEVHVKLRESQNFPYKWKGREKEYKIEWYQKRKAKI